METTQHETTAAEEKLLSLETLIKQQSQRVCFIAEKVILPKPLRSAQPKPVTDVIAFSTEYYDGLQKGPAKEFPYFIICISLIQLFFHFIGGGNTWIFLPFWYDPHRRHEIWRFFTVMLVHVSYVHLLANIGGQIIFGVLLEVIHHWKRIGIIYLTGVLGGSLSVTVLDPRRYAIGASAGVYALMFSCISSMLVNWKEMDCKLRRIIWLVLGCIIEVGPHLFNLWRTSASHAAHFGGAMTGFLVSILLLTNTNQQPWKKILVKLCGGILILLVVIAVIVNICFPSHYRKSEFNLDYSGSFHARTKNGTNVKADTGEDLST